MEEERFNALRVVQAAVDAGAEGRAEDDRAGERAVGAIADLGGFVDDLIVGRVDVVGELDLGDGAESVHGGADGNAGNAELRQWSVDDAVFAELLLKAVRSAKDTA